MAINRPLITILLLCNINTCITYSSAKEVRLTAITNFDELREIYLRSIVKLSENAAQDSTRTNTPDDTTIKKEICKHVFSSPYFGKMSEIIEEDLPESRILLKRTYRDTFTEFYKRSNNWPSRNILCNRCHRDVESRIMVKYEYNNACHLRNVADSSGFNVLEETVFRCLVRKQGAENEIRQYFVSKEYDINVFDTGSYSDYMAARFIFTLNSDNLLVLNALAEKTALIFTSGPRNVERLYLFIRGIHKPKIAVNDDPLCKMEEFEKLRICTSVLNSVSHKHKIKFEPDIDNVSNNCLKRAIVFQTEEITQIHKKPATEFEEWSIACSATTIEENTKTTFLISRGYGHNKVFLYREIGKKMFLDCFLGHVSIYDDDSVL